MSNNNVTYKLLTPEERQYQTDRILKVWDDFVKINDPNLEAADVFINKRTLVEVVERVSKRKYYFEVFHELAHISEFKETALYVFWIVKLKPFTVIKETSDLCASPNELFAVHLVLSALERIKKDLNVSNFKYPAEALISDFVYGLKYQDLTKESLVIYIEALATACNLPVFESNPIHI